MVRASAVAFFFAFARSFRLLVESNPVAPAPDEAGANGIGSDSLASVARSKV